MENSLRMIECSKDGRRTYFPVSWPVERSASDNHHLPEWCSPNRVSRP
jgi:hypothetical protein